MIIDDAQPNETKRCPFCDEEIRIKAVICKHCRQWMPGYTYESAIRDLVIQNQVTVREVSTVEEDMKSREGQRKLALAWAAGDKTLSFQGFDLSAQDLKGIDLSGADVRGTDIRETDLSGANLSGAKLSKANLFRSNLARANLRKIKLTDAYLRDANVEYDDLSGRRLLRAR